VLLNSRADHRFAVLLPHLFFSRRDPIIRRHFGSKAEPIIVPSDEDERIVGCPGYCIPGGPEYLRWFAVKQDQLTMCPDCGQVFKLSREAAQKPFKQDA